MFDTFKFIALAGAILVACQSCSEKAAAPEPGWPAVTHETKPWTRWWWQGSALTEEGITAELEAYKRAGIGGVEITPIYGVQGYEEQFTDYLSPRWMELLIHTLKEAARLKMGVDMATGTGWPFGGPWVNEADACKHINYKVYEVHEGARLKEKITFMQQPYVRVVGNQVYEVHDSFGGKPETTRGTRKEPLMRINPAEITIEQVAEPIEANKNLQALAPDQVKFKKPLALTSLMAYSDGGDVQDLTAKVDSDGVLDWTAPAGNWKLYALFQGWHGKMVERAAPGGEGNVIDHFSAAALRRYLHRFDSAFKGHDISSLRAFFNDSYEVDDARGSADWTPLLFDEFKELKGYDLRHHLPALFGHDEAEKNQRVLCDYRETISALVLNNFTSPWKAWAHEQSAIVRNQAHGSPANILDLYATVDIPEIEGVDPLRMKMASSAGNVTGKKLVSSESATWLNEHFTSGLGDIKIALDRFMLNGVNHIFYHGTCYSPPGEPWPGWLFYAAVHLNPRNSLWHDFGTLNAYVARSQSFLQNAAPDNDILLYYPVYDRFSAPGREMIEHFDGIDRQFEGTPFAHCAETLLARGFAFDYVSDRQIGNSVTESGAVKTEGGSLYKTIVVPQCQYIPAGTLKKIAALANEGATIIACKGLPQAVAGYAGLEQNKKSYDSLMQALDEVAATSQGIRTMTVGKGKILEGDSLEQLLVHASVGRETMADEGLQFIRKKEDGGRTVYFIANSHDTPFEGWLPVRTRAAAAVLYDPMNGEYGRAAIRESESGAAVYVQLAAKQTLLIETYPQAIETAAFRYRRITETSAVLTGPWQVTFTTGGPELPPAVETDTLLSWTEFGEDAYGVFSGTAVYTTSFAKPEGNAKEWLLDLGRVEESAEVWVNGQPAGTLIGPPYQLYIADAMLQQENTLEVKVSNLMANRIAGLDKRNVFWKKFYNINFPARKPENRQHGLFSAAGWAPAASGLLGPVKLTLAGELIVGED